MLTVLKEMLIIVTVDLPGLGGGGSGGSSSSTYIQYQIGVKCPDTGEAWVVGLAPAARCSSL